jgi:hypothetical protein
MPYARWEPGAPVPSAAGLAEYHRHGIADADAQFEHQETTLSHLLRIAHPALGGRTYGEALIDALLARDAIPAGAVRVLEIGGGLGYVARDAIARLRAAGRAVEYTIVELSPALAAAQRERVGAAAQWIEGDALAAELAPSAFDVVIANEMVGDLPALPVTRGDLGLAPDGTGTVDPERLRALGAGAALAADAGVMLDDAPDPTYLQTGAWQLTAKIAGWLAPGGVGVVTEFGDAAAWPRMSTHLDHPELSTHFGHLVQIARARGLSATVEFVIDLLDFDRAQRGLATTRSHFRALRALAESAGVDLPKVGYTPELLARATGAQLDLSAVGDLRWDRIEDRLMGLVPHEFRALVVRRPR